MIGKLIVTFLANSADDNLMIFLPENRHLHFMQGDNLHGILKHIFFFFLGGAKIRKMFQNVIS